MIEHTRDARVFNRVMIYSFIWAGDKEITANNVYGGKSHDGWRPLHINPQELTLIIHQLSYLIKQ